jgi:hypothetical protein
MSFGKAFAFALFVVALLSCAQVAHAQISIGVNIGAAPVCPYGYFDYPPYDCAPYGYYGSDWYTNGIFIGAGPWFHGRHGFYGHVDNRYDPHYGYHGPMPEHGDRPFDHFRGNEARDGQGHTGNPGHDASHERWLPGYRGGGGGGNSHAGSGGGNHGGDHGGHH